MEKGGIEDRRELNDLVPKQSLVSSPEPVPVGEPPRQEQKNSNVEPANNNNQIFTVRPPPGLEHLKQQQVFVARKPKIQTALIEHPNMSSPNKEEGQEPHAQLRVIGPSTGALELATFNHGK